MSGYSVLEAITPSRIGGAETYLAEICSRIPALDARVTLFCPAGRPFVEYASVRGIVPTTWRTYGKLDPLTLIRLARLASSVNADVIHTHLSTASLIGSFAARLARTRCVAHVHGMNSAYCFRFAERVIAVSEAVKAHLCAQGISPDRVLVVHNGIDTIEWQPIDKTEARNGAGLAKDDLIFGIFARLSPEKGHTTAIEAMRRLHADLPMARLLIVGDGRLNEELKAQASKSGISDAVTFTGFRTDIRELMACCDAVIVPSLREGFGLAAVEAMALAKPVVASNIGGLPEIVEDVTTGLLVPPSDPDTLAGALLAIIRDPEHTRYMGLSGRRRVEDRFNITRQIRILVDALGCQDA